MITSSLTSETGPAPLPASILWSLLPDTVLLLGESGDVVAHHPGRRPEPVLPRPTAARSTISDARAG